MSESPSLMKRTFGALADVAVDAVRDLTVAQLDVVASGLHQRLSTKPAHSEPAESAEIIDSALGEQKNHSVKIAPAILAGALIGVGVALLISIKR
jgi:hypothetical protein